MFTLLISLLITFFVIHAQSTEEVAVPQRSTWLPYPAKGCEVKDIMIPPGRMNMTRVSREESVLSCQKFCDRMYTFGMGCKGLAIHTREWETICLLCKNPSPDREIMPYSTFYSRTIPPKEGGTDYCRCAQEWVDYQDRLCAQICSHNFVDLITPGPTSETLGYIHSKWQKVTNDYKLSDYYNSVTGAIKNTFGSWPTKQPTADPWQLQRCSGCHQDRADIIEKVEDVGCKVFYHWDYWKKPVLKFTDLPTSRPTEEPSVKPTPEPTYRPSWLPTKPPVPRPQPPVMPKFSARDEGMNLKCLGCLREVGEVLSSVAQGCYMSRELCHDAPTKVVKRASECIGICEGIDS